MGPNKNLSLMYTGRKASDLPGELTVDEYEFATGLSFHQGNRWGDYAMMTVDESDGRTFWFTGEYMKDNNDWGTKIVSFQINRDTIDVGPIALVTPENSAYLTDTETVEVAIKNFGLEAQSNFDIGYIFEQDAAVIETVSVTIEPDSVYYHAFTPTVDMSVIGDYDFQLFTSLNDDQNIFNDTLRQVVSKTTRFDASITKFLGIEETICDSTRNVGVVLTNIGAEKLTEVDVTWDLNASISDTYNWTGSLLSGESDTVYFDLDPLVEGTNSFLVFSENPNGFLDEDLTNDTLSRDFEVVLGGGSVKLELLTDLYPNETSWELADDMGTILFSGGPYSSPLSLLEENWCLADGCYTFTIFDSFGDGIQAYGEEGDYTISDDNGIILASLIVANFGFSESNTFCVPFMCALEAEALTAVESEVGAGDGAINIVPVNGTAPFQYSIDGGTNFQTNPFFGSLNGGTYDVVVIDVNQCSFEIQVEIETCTLEFSVEVEDATSDDLTNGSITVQATNGNAPFSYSINGGTTFQDDNIFTDLTPGDYDVVVRDSLGCLSEIQVTVDIMVGIGTSIYGKSIVIYPNPTSGVFQIEVQGT